MNADRVWNCQFYSLNFKKNLLPLMYNCTKQETWGQMPFELSCLIWFKTLLEIIEFHNQSLYLNGECMIEQNVFLYVYINDFFANYMNCDGCEVRAKFPLMLDLQNTYFCTWEVFTLKIKDYLKPFFHVIQKLDKVNSAKLY